LGHLVSAYLPVVRSASLNGYADLAQSLGLDAQAMMRRAGLHARLLADPETPISTQAVRQLLEASAEASGAEDFGLQLASRRSLSNLGPISLVLKQEASARAALDTLCRYLRLLNASLLTRLDERDGLLRISEDIVSEPGARLTQSMQLAVGVMHRILRELLGPSWRPLWVAFKQAAPREPLRFERLFGTRVMFGADYNGIVCRAADLAQGLPGSQPELAAFARQYLDDALLRGQQSTRATVRQLIMALLPGGRCTAQQVADHLGVDRRTLHRHLTKEEVDFSRLLQAVRMETARQQLRHSQRPLSEVATLLGFSSASAFAYWFRESFGCSARQWRRAAP
jgi:AraC-like DNA-binding protein